MKTPGTPGIPAPGTPSTSRKTPAPGKPARPAPPSRLANEVRIIGGQWKRTRLPVADRPGLRPTPDRVRETLFNWLGQDLTGWRCVDAFAGTGALGFEAASRGAVDVLLVEQDAALVAQLRTTQAKLQATAVKVERGNGLTALERLAPGSVDLVFLDPPFDADIHARALAAAAAALADTGLLYLEAPVRWDDEKLAGLDRNPGARPALVVHRHLKAGAVHAHLLRRGS